ncbi:non-specific lipid-transfer protein A-like [Vigna radiata var. radiata]|uniref:Non-specific lipid-transfer protein n=1 Tax=Vigna radiata var. radiata TaxID=3916 RepID=A0A1S3UA82_VIGRR|nr:non-specific lipid-transfer protein A-like [Vigna radiata var. radiata]
MKKVSTLIVLLLTVAAMKLVNGFSCLEAQVSMLQCLPFFLNAENSPSTSCCDAVRNVRASAPTKPELREACQCLKADIAQFPKLFDDKVIQLPKLCKVDFGFPLTKDIDCNK